MTTTTYTVNAGNENELHPVWVNAETLIICENYARAWAQRGPGHWCEIIRDSDGEVVQLHEYRRAPDLTVAGDDAASLVPADRVCTRPDHGHDCHCDACVFCTCASCMAERRNVDPALLARVAYVLRDTPTPPDTNTRDDRWMHYDTMRGGSESPDPELVAHCTACGENPADEDSDLCLDCRTNAYPAGGYRQENDDSWASRGGGAYRDPEWELVRNDDKITHVFDRQDDAEAYAHASSAVSWTLYRYVDGRKTFVKQILALKPTPTSGQAMGQMLRQLQAEGFTVKRVMTLAAVALSLLSAPVAARDSFTVDPPSRNFPAYDLPYIGTPAYSDSCSIMQAWDDGSAIAYCTEDGATYVHDPDGFFATFHGIVFRGRPAGWYPVS